MIDGTYNVSVATPMGAQNGTVTLKQAGTKVTGEVDAPIVGKIKVSGTLVEENTFTAKGELRIMLMKVAYDLRGTVEGETLTVHIHSSKGDMKIEGGQLNFKVQ